MNKKPSIPMISHPFIILFFLLIICSLPIVSSLDILQKVMAQTNTTTTSSTEGAKVLVDDDLKSSFVIIVITFNITMMILF
ncbi:MAG: hypothetical protein WA421_18815 [Nitrososphaeraceae archaeon]